MKKALCVLLTFAVLFSSMLSLSITANADNNEIIVFDGSDTSGFVPSYSIYKHSKSQYIIPSDELSSVTGQSLTAIKWHMQSYKSSRNVEVYLCETENECLSGFIEVPEQNMLYDGFWIYDEDSMEVCITFSNPFDYYGSNLLITVIDKTDSWKMGNSFFGENTDNSSWEIHSDSNSYTSYDISAGESKSFVPKTTVVSNGEYFHIHTMTAALKKDATCTEMGKEAYYFCEGCGRYFEDFCGDSEISDIDSWGSIKQLGHDWGEWVSVTAATCTSNGEEKRVCNNDSGHFEIRNVPIAGHSINKVSKKQATTAAAGNTEYYECSRCHKYFKDAAAKTEITDKKSVVIPKVIVDKKLSVDNASISTELKTDKKTVTVKWKSVKSAADYEINYRKAGASKWISKTTNGKNSYVIKSLTKGGLYEFRIRTVAVKGKQKTVSPWSGTCRIYIYQANQTKLAAGRGSFTVKWKKDKNASSYEIQYATDKNFTKNVKKASVSGSATSKTVKNLKKGKKYFVRIRAIKKKDNKSYFGKFSDEKSVTTKK